MSKLPPINQLLSMARGMAKEMEEKMAAIEVEGNAGGGMVRVRLNGRKQVLALTIAPEAVDPVDVEMLQDLIVAACHDAQAKVDEKLKEDLGQFAGGLPGGFPFGGL